MSRLTEEQREKLLAALRHADDIVLMEAVAEHKARIHAEQKLWDEVRNFSGCPAPKLSLPPPPPAPTAPVTEEALEENVEPPYEACTRIGQKNKDGILTYCTKPRTEEEIAKFIKARDIGPLLRLLWDRNLLTYDGEEYASV